MIVKEDDSKADINKILRDTYDNLLGGLKKIHEL